MIAFPSICVRTVLLLLGLGGLAIHCSARHVLVEAEQFSDTGGWDVDQQFMEQMGSSYLLAHGLGVPVKDAVTAVKFAMPGKYRVWVRTRDWVAPWKAPGAPGKFQLLVNGKALAETFGTKGGEWHWQDGGLVAVTENTTLALHDLTGFEGRCDAVLFSSDASFEPPNQFADLAKFRTAQLGLPVQPDDGGSFDLVVVGGGVAGTSAAVSAARNGLKVALVQDRPVLGGNASSEVRVWPEGHTRQQPFIHIGEIVEEICPERTKESRNASAGRVFDDERKLRVVRAEKNITLFLECRVNAVGMADKKIVSVTAQNTRSARTVELTGKFFADCTGDATVGFLAGADYMTSDHGREYNYQGPYWAPYRTLYSRNIVNLFMAGRNISVTREALGAVRVMRTTGMMGEIVGKAAWICVRHQTSPRGVYESHLPLLKELMAQPGLARRESPQGK